MHELEVLEIGKEAIWILLKVISPIMLTGMTVGLIVSLFQALTQIQEMTLTFIPKILAIFFAILLFIPFIGEIMQNFVNTIMEIITKI
ncbi:MAG: flagellar biosynthesis protein FliQ [Rickettsiaceae bacterium H1]|nr:flagellar biosynthesis protein FliQ [Rickettsiaceae bacterium H1]